MRRQVMPKLRAFIDHVNSRSPAKRLPERELPDNPGHEALGAGDQPDAVAFSPEASGTAFDLVGSSKLKDPKTSATIGIRRSFANLLPRIRIHNRLAIRRGMIPGVVWPRGCCPGLVAVRPRCSWVESGS